MKTLFHTLAITLLVGTALAETETLSSAVQKGLFEEEVNRDFRAAITAYESAVEEYDHVRQLAATALFRLAENYRRAGRTQEAEALYERVAREFHDQTELAERAIEHLPEERLNALGARTADVLDDEEEREIERLQALFRNSPDLLYSIDSQREPGVRTVARNTRLHEAIERGQLRVAEFLIDQGLDVEAGNRLGLTALHLAAQRGFRAGVELLVNLGSDVNSPVEGSGLRRGRTPLHFAAEQGHLSIIEFLLEEGADPNVVSAEGSSPLQWAAVSRAIQAVHLARLLLDHGADVNASHGDGWTALHSATNVDNAEMVQLLLEWGADANARLSDGTVALHRAVAKRNLDVIKLLIEHGADVNVLNERGRSPLDTVLDDRNRGAARNIEALLREQNGVPARDIEAFLREHGAREGKFHIEILGPAPLQSRLFLWERSDALTLMEALERADIAIEEVGPVNTGYRTSDDGVRARGSSGGSAMGFPSASVADELVILYGREQIDISALLSGEREDFELNDGMVILVSGW